MKPYITAEEVIEKQGENQRTYRFLTTENGCVNGCASGTTIYANTEFSNIVKSISANNKAFDESTFSSVVLNAFMRTHISLNSFESVFTCADRCFLFFRLREEKGQSSRKQG